MAVFDESKIINALHTDKAEVGKKYYCADNFLSLKESVENKDTYWLSTLKDIIQDRFPFETEDDYSFQLLYPYEEPSNKLMTKRQLAEWLARGNGFYTKVGWTYGFSYYKFTKEDSVVEDDIRICYWDSEEWIKPTVDIYERDCKGGKK